MNKPDENPVSMPAALSLLKLWYLLGTLMLLGVAVVSLVPAPGVGVGDKLSHLLTYFVLGGWFSLLAANRVALGWTIVALVGYGMLLELLQGMTSYRYAEWGDVLANGIGVIAGILLYFSPLPRLLRWIDGELVRILQR